MSIWFVDTSKNKEVKQELERLYYSDESAKKLGFLLLSDDKIWFLEKYIKAPLFDDAFRFCFFPNRMLSFLYSRPQFVKTHTYIDKEAFSKDFGVLHSVERVDSQTLGSALLLKGTQTSPETSERLRAMIDSIEKNCIIESSFRKRLGG